MLYQDLEKAAEIAETLQDRIVSVTQSDDETYVRVIWTPYTLNIEIGEICVYDNQANWCELEVESVWRFFQEAVKTLAEIAAASPTTEKQE